MAALLYDCFLFKKCFYVLEDTLGKRKRNILPMSRNSFSSTPFVIRSCATNQQDCPSTSYSPMGRLVTVIENTFGVTYVQFLITYLYIRWLLRFEFQLPHPILRPALATDKKWPLSQFHISYQNSEISWPKVPISDFQSQFSMSKIILNISSWRKRGSASNPKMEYQILSCIFH